MKNILIATCEKSKIQTDIVDLLDSLGDSLDTIIKSTRWEVQVDINNDGDIKSFKHKELVGALFMAQMYKLDIKEYKIDKVVENYVDF